MKSLLCIIAITCDILIIVYTQKALELTGVYLFLCVLCPALLLPLFLFLDVSASYGRLPRRK